VALAQRIFLLHVGRHGIRFSPTSSDATLRESYSTAARRALEAAEAFITESRKENP